MVPQIMSCKKWDPDLKFPDKEKEAKTLIHLLFLKSASGLVVPGAGYNHHHSKNNSPVHTSIVVSKPMHSAPKKMTLYQYQTFPVKISV